MDTPILQIRELDVAFGSQSGMTNVIDGLNLDIRTGECLGLVGESGSGKSMTALAMMQLLPLAARVGKQSQILLDGEDLLNLSERKMRHIRGGKIGMIFQDAMAAFNPVYSIREQMLEVLKLHKNLTGRAAKKEALRLLDEVGIKDPERTLRSYPHQLSGGMRQRAMIAMAIGGEPKLLIADEPTTALDVTIQAQVIDLLNELKNQHGTTLLFISHDLAVVSQLADNIAVLKTGIKVENVQANEFFREPKHAYSKHLIASIPSNESRHTGPIQTNNILQVDDLKVHFPIKQGILKRTVGHVKAVDGVSFNIPQGQTLALVGESGSGKTTTGKAILQLLHNTSGAVTFENHNLTTLNRQKMQLLREDMQIIFQDPYSSLNPRMMVIDCIAEGLIAQKKVRNRKQAEAIVDSMLEQVEMDSSVKWRYPHEFSGGQRQRICIARALALEPKLLILDEPTSALDVSIQMQILNLLESLQQRLGLSYLLITHNLAVVAYMAHALAVMYHGKIVEQGPTAELLQHPKHDYTRQLLAAIPTIKCDFKKEAIS